MMTAGEMVTQGERPDRVPEALRRFIWDIQSVVELAESEREILLIGSDLMRRLIASGDWLPPAFSGPGASGRQYLIYRDGMERFCVVSTILAPGSELSIAQPAIWEISGVLAGSIARRESEGSGAERMLAPGGLATAPAGRADACHLANADGARAAIAVHVYGGDIAGLERRSGADGREPQGYANEEHAPAYDIFSIQADRSD